MSEGSGIPRGGVDLRKYAAITLALGLARGALMDAQAGDLEDVKHILDLTAASKIAEALGCTESELAIDWAEHLTASEANSIKGR